MRASIQSLVESVAAGALIGLLGLAVRYAPIRGSVSSASPVRAPQTPPGATAALPAAATPAPSSPEGAAAPSSEPAPAAPAACPSDMALVEGEFCPALPYDCARPSGAVGCAEYVRRSRCLEETDHRRYCIDHYEWPNKVGDNPLVYVDWFEAKALCASVNKRLCRRSEWILACEGPKRLPFPWGFVRQPSPCNIDRQTFDFDVYAMIKEETREGELARLWQADRIGTHPACVSAFGAFDMAGNVDEWTDDLADNPGSRHVSTLNGGYWGPVRDTCRLTTTSHGPTFKFYQVGFRCCADTGDGVDVPPPRPFLDHDTRGQPTNG